MALKITASDLITRRYVAVHEDYVEFCTTALVGGVKKLRYPDIDAVLLSAKGLLSLHVGTEIYSLPTKPGDPKHQEVIDALVRGVKAAHGA